MAVSDNTINLRTQAFAAIGRIADRSLVDDETISNTVTPQIQQDVQILHKWLCHEECKGEDSKVAFMALLTELRLHSSLYPQELLEMALKTLTAQEVEVSRFSYLATNDAKFDILTTQLLKACNFSTPLAEPLWFRLRGSVCVTASGLWLMATEQQPSALKNTPDSLTLVEKLHLLRHKEATLKQTDQNKVDALISFARDFETIQKTAINKPAANKKRKFVYNAGEEVPVRIKSNDGVDIMLQSIDPDYQSLEGPLVSKRQSLLYYLPEHFKRVLKQGDYLTAQLISSDPIQFCIDDSFVNFIDSDASQYLDHSLSALLIRENKKEYVWLDELGHPVYTDKSETHALGDVALVHIIESGRGNNIGYIKGEIEGECQEPLNETDIREETIKDYCDCIQPEESLIKATEKQPQTQVQLNPILLRLLAHQLVDYQKYQMKVSHRCQLLVFARALFVLLADAPSVQYIDFLIAYLKGLSDFMSDADLSAIHLKKPETCSYCSPILRRQSIIQILKEWRKNGDQEMLLGFSQDTENSQELRRLAEIVMAANGLRNLGLEQLIHSLKLEAIKTLQVANEGDLSLENEGRKNIGLTESQTVEFKKSVVFPPAEKQEQNYETQVRNVLRGVCGFLNSADGGTLYVGVSDNGYIYGIQDDLKALKCKSVDEYSRVYIQDRAIHEFGKEVVGGNITIKFLFENQVVAIEVKPYPYGIVKLGDVAYLRINAETRVMTPILCEQVLNAKRTANLSDNQKILDLSEAKRNKKIAILHSYASGNSGRFSDRTVEPFLIESDPKIDILQAFDVDKQAVRCFRLSRIGNVEVTTRPWVHEGLHQIQKRDAFRMTGTKSIRCLLRLNMRAYSLLIEEAPEAKSCLSKEKKTESWLLDINVYNIVGIGRFYMGLINDIEILDAPELKEYAQKMAQQIIQA